ncbi:hypothetical protein Fcan01_01334 [Folsomia candida]|uniref:Uncharacterized protein n=1 Tax=Folsomia candida TaxID=158441 RepID=A0A226F5S3_FOLCA|nr:hypothetical protein Fcan01_01334 [Folsomia candida]
MRLISYVTMTIGCVEQMQMTAMLSAFITSIVISWERIENLTSQLPTKTGRQFCKAVTNYRQLHVIGNMGKHFVMLMVIGVLWIVSLLSSGFTYVTIKLYGKMPTKVYLLAPYISVMTFFVTYFVLRGLEGINKKCVEGLVNLKLCRVRRSLERRVANSIQVFAIPCGVPGYKIFQIEDGYKTQFYANVLDTTWNLLLSFPNP